MKRFSVFLCIFVFSLLSGASNGSAEDAEVLKKWGEAPNTIPNPGMENLGPDKKPLNWESVFPSGKSLAEIQKTFGFSREVEVLNTGFEEVEPQSEFFRYAKIRKIGRIKYHKDVWKRGLNLKDYISSGLLTTNEIYPAIEKKIVRQGENALKFEVKKSRGFSWSEVYMDSVFQVKPYTEYLLTFWYYHSGNDNVYGNLWLNLGGKRYIRMPDLDRHLSNRWKQYAFYFRTGDESGNSAVQFWGTCEKKGVSGSIIFDEIRILTHDVSWDAGMWEMSGDTPHSGKYCLKVKETRMPLKITCDPIGIDWHKKYLLTAWVKAEKASGSNFVRINWKRYADKYNTETIKTTDSSPIVGSSDWRKISVPLVPPETAQFMEVEIFSQGNSGDWMVDDIFMDGFGDMNIEFLISQAGFEASGYKDMVIRTKERFSSPVTMEIYRKGMQGPVLVRSMNYTGTCRWNRFYYRAEFSEIRSEGIYFARIKYGDGKKSDTPVFPVKKNLYKDLAKKGLQYFYYQRSGCAVRGVHKAIHLDDAWVTNFNTSQRYNHVDLTGGWFDAADLNKWLNPQGWYLRSICNLYDWLGDRSTDFFKETLPDAVEEAKWGAEYIRKSYKGNGDFYFCVKIHDWRTPPEDDTDNIPGNEDDRCSNVVSPETCGTLGLASFARIMKNVGYGDYSAYLETAEDAFAGQTESAETVKKLAMRGIQKDNVNLTLSAMDLYRATAKPKYLAFARQHVKEIAQDCIEGNYIPKEGQAEPDSKRLLYFLEPLEEFALNFPAEEETAVCKKALGIVADHMVGVSNLSPLMHTQTLTKNPSDSKIILSQSRSSTYLLCSAFHLAAMAEVLQKPDLLPIAERDLQYVLGRNFQGASCMTDVGWKWGAHFTYLYTCPGFEKGIIPYTVNKGHALGTTMFRTGMPYAVMPGKYSPSSMQEWNLEVYGVTQSFLLKALSRIAMHYANN